MQVDVLTIFPEMFDKVLNETILKRAQDKGLVKIVVHNLRDWATDKHKITDDRPFGGGPGMVMKPEPIFSAVEQLKKSYQLSVVSYKRKENKKLKLKTKIYRSTTKTVLLTPKGRVLKQHVAKELSMLDHIILICGRYEGVDERVREFLVDDEISIGDYVLSGGEIPAMVVIDTVVRLIPGVLGNEESLGNESFNNGGLDYPHYTQPRDFRGMKVPDVLLSGDHGKIEQWRKKQAAIGTKEKRPDLLK